MLSLANTALTARRVAQPQYLLDLYPGAVFAPALRRLRAGYAADAARVRRSSDNAEALVGFSGADFDGAAFSAHVGGGSGFARYVYDQAASPSDAGQATAGAQPQIVPSAIGGRAALLGDGARSLVVGDVAALGLQTLTAYFVASKTANGEYLGLWGLQTEAGGNAAGFAARFADTNALQVFVVTSGGVGVVSTSTAYTDTAPRVFCVRKSGTSLRIYEGLTQRASGTLPSATIDYTGTSVRTTLMGYWTGSFVGVLHKGYLVPPIIWDAAHDDATREAITTEIAAYFGL